MMDVVGDRQEILQRLELLSDELKHAGEKARIRLVGGAAIALEYDYERAATTDVDSVSLPLVVSRCAKSVAAKNSWDENWLNAAALAFLPPMHDAAWAVVAEFDYLTVEVASAKTLLAMKLHAGRGVRDDSDVATLSARLGLTSAGEAIEIYEQNYPNEAIPERSLIGLDELFGAH